ncbi:MAG: hypothetical protein OXE50_08250, partial [Chloroflexi bacterium]|nr:hypothetical protein [Chloroflexota bacterium]
RRGRGGQATSPFPIKGQRGATHPGSMSRAAATHHGGERGMMDRASRGAWNRRGGSGKTEVTEAWATRAQGLARSRRSVSWFRRCALTNVLASCPAASR